MHRPHPTAAAVTAQPGPEGPPAARPAQAPSDLPEAAGRPAAETPPGDAGESSSRKGQLMARIFDVIECSRHELWRLGRFLYRINRCDSSNAHWSHTL